jgi:thioester reductase-like protein
MRLLPRILELDPGARIECLVQEKFLDMAKAAVETLEAQHEHARGRVGLVVGDITRPGLGIEAKRARQLQRSLKQAWHLAAVYDLAVKRDVGRRINVEGTKTVLDFVGGAPKFERLQYVSTAYVSGSHRGTYRETDLDVGQGFKNHYEETKFQAEVEVARSQVPHTIYRPGVVVGDSKTGETAKFDGPYHVLRLMEKLPSPGVFFRIGMGFGTVNIVPVDFVVEAMAVLSACPVSSGRTYHLCDPQPHSPGELAEMFAEAIGKRFLFVPVPMAVARAFFSPKPVQRFFGMPLEALDYFDDPVRHDTTQATRDLADLGIECPRLADYLPQLVSFYESHREGVRREAMV